MYVCMVRERGLFDRIGGWKRREERAEVSWTD